MNKHGRMGTKMSRCLFQIFALLCTLAASSAPAASLYFVHTDHLGTPQKITDSGQQVVWEGSPMPFGETEVVVNQIDFYVRFPGQYQDGTTGLYYNYNRDYDPSLGRYIQSDPIGLNGGINTYAYVGGNPLSYVDPLGLFSSEAHDYLIDRLGKQRGWSGAETSAAKLGSRYADNFFRGHQSGENSFMHAMTSDANTSKAEACRKANEYIDRMRRKAEGYKGRNDYASGHALGEALHPIMDNRSPAHEGFQKWDNSQIGRHGDNIPYTPFGSHTEEDLSALLANPQLIDQILNDMNNFLDNSVGIDCSCY